MPWSGQCILLAMCCIGLTSGCPFAGMTLSYNYCRRHHSSAICDQLGLGFGESSSARTLLSIPGIDLPAPEIPLANNSFIVPALLLKVGIRDFDFVDLVALYAAGQLHPVWPGLPPPPAETIGKDMCIFSFQGLPPPPGDDRMFKIPRQDADRAWELCKMANSRFQNEVGPDKHGGALVFGGCTIGAQGAKDLCEYNISAETNSTYCNTPAQTSPINWPQSVTIFKVRPNILANDELKNFMQQWRALPEFHKPHLDFVFEGGTGSAAGSKVPGWGAGGMGISRKVVPCDAISSKYMYPNKTAPDSLNAAKTRTVMEEAYLEWKAAAHPCPHPPAQRGPCELRPVRGQLGPVLQEGGQVRLLRRAGQAGPGADRRPQGLRQDRLRQLAGRRHRPAGDSPLSPPSPSPRLLPLSDADSERPRGAPTPARLTALSWPI